MTNYERKQPRGTEPHAMKRTVKKIKARQTRAGELLRNSQIRTISGAKISFFRIILCVFVPLW